MLVLSRKKQESIRIGDNIEVIVLEVTKNRVRLGFRCPDHVSITRSEIRNFAMRECEMELELPLNSGVEHELAHA